MNCTTFKETAILSLYGELPPERRAELDTHAAACPSCAAEYSRIRKTLDVMAQRTRTEPSPEDWKALWNELEVEIADRPARPVSVPIGRRVRQAVMAYRFLAYGIAAFILLVTGAIVGSKYFPGAPSPELTQPRTAETVSSSAVITPVDSRVHDYLVRSKVLLLGLVNTDDITTGSSTREQRVSRDLIRQASDLKKELTHPEQERIRQLVSDLEVILLQLANYEETYDVPAVEMIRRGVDRKALLLKINLEEMRTGY